MSRWLSSITLGHQKICVAGIHPVPPTRDPASWADTLETVRAWSQEKTEMPLVLAGDFNATRAQPGFRALATGFAQSAPSWGPIGIGSWPANTKVPAFAANDHVLARGLAAGRSVPLVVAGTDHHGIVARLASCR
ncbi:endonuclease/exonuclease/phosphatase family protein [Paeniglutamicibacter antarcticus]|uniref:Endonuclease/exonuclease/phosphatase domain-containing protein n=1 Tax=Paeniglutamicibacter antarcticus TaxID=494023 RepID=A0ABP9TS75_9MICC